MFKRIPKKQNRLLRLILRFLKVYAVENDKFNLVNPAYENEGKSIFEFNKRSFIFPNGFTDITRKIKSCDILLRYCSTNALWQSSDRWKRIIPNINKEDLILTCLHSLKKSINSFLNLTNINIKLHLIDDGHDENFNKKIEKSLSDFNGNYEFYKTSEKGNRESYNFCLKIAKNCEDLVFFLEDDYLFKNNSIEELLSSYSLISTKLKEDIIICPSDYSFFYDGLYKTSLILGAKTKYRFVGETLMTFLISKDLVIKNYSMLEEVAIKNNDPFELPLHNIYKKHPCVAPVNSLVYHISNAHSGISPHEDWKKIWDINYLEYKSELKKKWS